MKNKSFWNNKVIAVTGSSGFVGTAIVNRLKADGVRVIEVSRRAGVDIHDFPKLLEAMRPANYIINTAAIDGNSEFKRKNSAFILEENIQIAVSILACAAQLNIRDLTMLSSAAVYGEYQDEAVGEDYDFYKNYTSQQNGYALSKWMTEVLATQFATTYSGKVLIPRPANLYGQNDPHKRFISTISTQILAQQPISILGDGTQKTSFVFLDDFISILLELIENEATGIINIAGNENVSLIELATLISEIVQQKLTVNYVDKDVRQPNRILDNARLESMLQYRYTPIKEGLKSSIRKP